MRGIKLRHAGWFFFDANKRKETKRKQKKGKNKYTNVYLLRQKNFFKFSFRLWLSDINQKKQEANKKG